MDRPVDPKGVQHPDEVRHRVPNGVTGRRTLGEAVASQVVEDRLRARPCNGVGKAVVVAGQVVDRQAVDEDDRGRRGHDRKRVRSLAPLTVQPLDVHPDPVGEDVGHLLAVPR